MIRPNQLQLVVVLSAGAAQSYFATVTGGMQPFARVATSMENDVELALTGRIPVGHWTTVKHLPPDASTCSGFLPGDVNGNRVANTVDGSG